MLFGQCENKLKLITLCIFLTALKLIGLSRTDLFSNVCAKLKPVLIVLKILIYLPYLQFFFVYKLMKSLWIIFIDFIQTYFPVQRSLIYSLSLSLLISFNSIRRIGDIKIPLSYLNNH